MDFNDRKVNCLLFYINRIVFRSSILLAKIVYDNSDLNKKVSRIVWFRLENHNKAILIEYLPEPESDSFIKEGQYEIRQISLERKVLRFLKKGVYSLCYHEWDMVQTSENNLKWNILPKKYL